jgi:demethylmenaquinone methyltransferase/2-methoxy-6-polyprenyl-1,4-benzoquinol methylase/ArsR family transcriptional regulator
MCSDAEVTMDALIAMLRAAGDPTRLRLLLLLRQAELTVSELIEIVGQSQPRVSRHLKLLMEAELLERFKEGSWVFYRASEQGKGADFAGAIAAIAAPESAILETDRKRLSAVRETRAAEAAAYFKANAAQWERIRALHAPEKDVEAAIVRHIAATPMDLLLDAGTGTGRIGWALSTSAAISTKRTSGRAPYNVAMLSMNCWAKNASAAARVSHT